MIKDIIEKLAFGVGFDIGTSDDISQSNLLNGFSKGLNNSMRDDNLNMQLCYIVDKLDQNSIKIIKMLNGYVELREEEEKNNRRIK